MKARLKFLIAVGATLLAGVPVAGHAAVSWSLSASNCIPSMTDPATACGQEFANERGFGANTSGVSGVIASGWANTMNNDMNTPSLGAGATLEKGEIAQYGGGLGVRNADWNRNNTDGTPQDANENTYNPPEHAVDNNERNDLVLFDFGVDAVSLSQISIGCCSDTDITVLAYTGANPPVDLDLTGRLLGEGTGTEDLTTNGWSLIGSYDIDAQNPSNSVDISGQTGAGTAGAIYASYWIVGAYMDQFSGGPCPTGGCYLNGSGVGNDHVKLLTLAGDVFTPPPPNTNVPEPLTLALFAGALPFVRRVRGRGDAMTRLPGASPG